MIKFRSFWWTYVGLWLIRTWFALYGTGYIHPDEHMQNGEVSAGKVLGLHTLTTWEWRPDFPVRSVLPPFATTAFPLLILRSILGPERVVCPLLVFRAQRLAFLCLSGVLDYSIFHLVSLPAPRRLCLLLFASSYVTCAFQVRPFSNSLESALVALSLVVFKRIVGYQTRLRVRGRPTDERRFCLSHNLDRELHLLALLAVIGTFTRPTFIAFTLPIVYQLFWLLFQIAGSPARVVGMLLPPLLTAMLATFVFIAADTYYFRGDFSKLVVTPYNFVKYNLSTENLVDHGLHPRWLHIGVNLPVLLGPLLLWFTWRSISQFVESTRLHTKKMHFETNILRQTLILIVMSSLSILSLQPHQEPRFLTPLILPIIVLVATAKLPQPSAVFWVTWIVFNVVFVLVFGVSHQGGVVPSLLSLHSKLSDTATSSTTHIIYWKTYMPPRHLLGVSQRDIISGKILLTDLSGAPNHDLVAALTTPSFTSVYLVTPVSMYAFLPRGFSSCMSLEEQIFPHLDLDHIPESIEAGGVDALSLGIYAVQRSCILEFAL